MDSWPAIKLVRVSRTSSAFGPYQATARRTLAGFGEKPLLAEQKLEIATEWLESVVTQLGPRASKVLCSRKASLFELAVQVYVSKKFFKLCVDLGLPIQIEGRHSALASVLLGGRPHMADLWGYVRGFELTNDALMTILDRVFDHQIEIDFKATTACGTDQRKLSECNVLQSAILCGEAQVLDRVIASIKAAGDDLHLLLHNYGRSNIFHLILDEITSQGYAVDMELLISILHKRRLELGVSRSLLNMRNPHGEHLLARAFSKNKLDVMMRLYDIGVEIPPELWDSKLAQTLESMASCNKANRPKWKFIQTMLADLHRSKERAHAARIDARRIDTRKAQI